MVLHWGNFSISVTQCVFIIPGSTGDIELTEFPTSLAMSLEQRATISFRASKSVIPYGFSYMHWLQQKPAQSPKLFIHRGSNTESEFPATVIRSGCEEDFTLIIYAVEADDASRYYSHNSVCLSQYDHILFSNISFFANIFDGIISKSHNILQGNLKITI